jgi:TolA-binding protein
MKLLVCLITLIGLTACKTAAQIEREQIVDNLSLQMSTNQKMAADVTTKMSDLETKMNNLTGKFEELENTQKTSTEESQKNTQELQTKITALTMQMDEQREFIGKLTKVLAKADPSLKTKSTTTVKIEEKGTSPYDEAMSLYKKGKYAKALTMLKELNDDPQFKGEEKARILHNIGLISYAQKNNDDSLLYLGQLYTQHSKSELAPNALLHIGLSFKAQGKKDESDQALTELIEKYPKSKPATKARDLLKN